MSQNGDIPVPSKRARRSRLFRSRPDALLVEEWVPNITLPPPPDAPLEEDDPAEARLDEHGLPRFEDEAEEQGEEQAGPARLFVGMGRRGASVSQAPDGEFVEAEADEGDAVVYQGPDDYFVAELRLPRPEDSLPFRIGALGGVEAGDEEEGSDFLLDAAEASDPSLAFPELDAPFSVSLEPPDPIHLGSFDDDEEEQVAADDEDSSEDLDGLVDGGVPPLSLQASPARLPLSARSDDQPTLERSEVPLSRPRSDGVPGWATAGRPEPEPSSEPESDEVPVADAPAPAARPRPAVVLRSRPFWTRERRMPEAKPAEAPVFQPREAPQASPIKQKLFTWPTLLLLLAMAMVAIVLLLTQSSWR
jgi:hypothetical protein